MQEAEKQMPIWWMLYQGRDEKKEVDPVSWTLEHAPDLPMRSLRTKSTGLER
jgi:hypothetical protein